MTTTVCLPSCNAAHAAGNLIGSLAIIAAVSYCGIFAVSGTAAVNTAVAKTSLPFGQVVRLLSLVHGLHDHMHRHYPQRIEAPDDLVCVTCISMTA